VTKLTKKKGDSKTKAQRQSQRDKLPDLVAATVNKVRGTDASLIQSLWTYANLSEAGAEFY
jgi:hypothetical protein